ncbi:MAG: hypothetical protein ACR2N6_02955 [Miltoncostaeaceae bacterium]
MIRRLTTLSASLLAAATLAVACGPESPVEGGGEAKDPVALATVLPTADGLTEVQSAMPSDAAALAEALTGGPNPAVAERLTSRGLSDAAVRRWEGPGGASLVVATSAWPSHVTATSVGAQAAEALLDRPEGRAWTPRDIPGSRGARVPGTGPQSARALSFAVGPNSLYVRSAGPVDEDVVVRSVSRLRLVAEGDAAGADSSG